MNLSRRQFLTRSAVAGMTALAPMPLLAKERPPLTIPPLLDMGRGRPLWLEFRTAQTQFEPQKLVEVWGGNGHYLAPTVRVRSGNFVKLTYINSLPQPLSINIQGLQASSEMIGSPHRKLEPNSRWSPIFSVNQTACSAWYHADTPLNSAFQLYRGIAGLWIIEDSYSRQAKLPNNYGINDIPLILQDMLINKEGEPVFDRQAPRFFGKRLFVNGKASPYLNVPRGWVRLRIVNASLSRRYELGLDNGKPLYLIASGLGTLATPLEVPSVAVAPSERVELLVDLNDGEKVSLINGAKRGILEKTKLLFSEGDDLIDNVVLELRPEGLPSALAQDIQLPPFNLEDFHLKIDQERKFEIKPQDRLINGQRFDPKRIDVVAKQGSVERWYLTAEQAVGFSLQGAKFVIETRNRQKVPHNQLAWHDTLWLERGQETTILVKFDHTASEQLPFTFGVSDFMLRDRGCMGQMAVEA